MGIDTILIILVLVCGFYAAWNIGANDVANAMGTSVGSGALSLRSAVILAAIFEFAGAVMVGSTVTDTIRNKMFEPTDLNAVFGEKASYILACGMIASLLASGTWLLFATYMHWPVSTTHTIVGAVVGFGCLALGVDGIQWGEVGKISGSWIISPILAAVVSYLCFGAILKTVFYQPHPVRAAKRMAPWFAAMTLGLMTWMVAFKGLKDYWRRIGLKTDNLYFVLSVCLAAFVLAMIAYFVMKYLVRNVDSETEADGTPHVNPELTRSLGKTIKHLQRVSNSSTGELKNKVDSLLKEVQLLEVGAVNQALSYSRNPDLRQVEKIFVGLQILTACFVAFAHGANDVANAVGPLSAAFQAVNERTISLKATTPSWALYLGGAGIVAGLAMWGFKVIRTVGEKITELTPSRGFCAEFSASLTIMLGSIMGLPLSTTHTLVGAVLGIGLAKGISGLNLRVLRDIVASWVITVPIGALLCIFFYFILKLLLIDANLFELPPMPGK